MNWNREDLTAEDLERLCWVPDCESAADGHLLRESHDEDGTPRAVYQIMCRPHLEKYEHPGMKAYYRDGPWEVVDARHGAT